jgi:hypothetical protein
MFFYCSILLSAEVALQLDRLDMIPIKVLNAIQGKFDILSNYRNS